uniref:BPTI/Kunitz inhibitor domain-containing protein n=1 Tax=Romanomermis culicivorax TaxID=13658 RepID=A0A915K2P8_ROMCU
PCHQVIYVIYYTVTSENRCDLPLAIGIGSFSLLRWYYNSFYKECVTFQYKGLQGNANSFATKEECSEICPGFTNVCAAGTPLVVKGKPKICGPKSPCPPGYWCHVGASVDTTLCCPGGGGNPCDIGLSIGHGHSQLRRFYFDPKSSLCMEFMYQGMMGNANNFITRSDCETRCPKWLNPCLKGFPAIDTNNRPQVCIDNEDCPAAHAPCDEELTAGQGNLTNLKRWYFNKRTRSCQIFDYRGHKGNANNFLNKLSCERTCPVFVSPCPADSGFTSFEKVRQCDAREMNSDCPQDHWCHVGYDSTTTICCPN